MWRATRGSQAFSFKSQIFIEHNMPRPISVLRVPPIVSLWAKGPVIMLCVWYPAEPKKGLKLPICRSCSTLDTARCSKLSIQVHFNGWSLGWFPFVELSRRVIQTVLLYSRVRGFEGESSKLNSQAAAYCTPKCTSRIPTVVVRGPPWTLSFHCAVPPSVVR